MCWGAEVVKKPDGAKDISTVREGLKQISVQHDRSITAVFEQKGKEKVTYSYWQHTQTETQIEIVKWVAKSMRPFSIVEDDGFCMLMKTGRPEYYISSRYTVACDVKHASANGTKPCMTIHSKTLSTKCTTQIIFLTHNV
jgi:hypothetical protein